MSAIANVHLDGTDKFELFDLVSLQAPEELGRMYEFDLVVRCEKSGLDPADMLGKPVSAFLILQDGIERRFNGIICRMGRGSQYGRFFEYWFSVRPEMAMLGYRSDARVYQAKTVLQVIDDVVSHVANVTPTRYKPVS